MVMGTQAPSVYQQVIEKTKGIMSRTQELARNIEKKLNVDKTGYDGVRTTYKKYLYFLFDCACITSFVCLGFLFHHGLNTCQHSNDCPVLFLFSFPYFSVQPDDFYVNKESSTAPILF